eukprot:m.97973 g.97973  ORF g.97973 m.97973 type:complete len:51 (-) comp51378_c0_seq4:170-322(-)
MRRVDFTNIYGQQLQYSNFSVLHPSAAGVPLVVQQGIRLPSWIPSFSVSR